MINSILAHMVSLYIDNLEANRFSIHKPIEYYEAELIRLADTNYLKRLTSDLSPHIRFIAFKALLRLNYSGLKTIFISHLYDNQFFDVRSRGEIRSIPINISLYGCIHDSLPQKDKIDFRKIIEKQYDKGAFDWYLYDRRS